MVGFDVLCFIVVGGCVPAAVLFGVLQDVSSFAVTTGVKATSVFRLEWLPHLTPVHMCGQADDGCQPPCIVLQC